VNSPQSGRSPKGSLEWLGFLLVRSTPYAVLFFCLLIVLNVMAPGPFPFVKVNLGLNPENTCSISLNEDYGEDDQHLKTPEALDDLMKNRGFVTFVELDLTIDTSREDGLSAADAAALLADPCYGDGLLLSRKTLASVLNFQPAQTDDAFALTVEKEFKYSNGQEEYLATAMELILPIYSGEYTTVNLCEGHCYRLKGPVQIREIYSSEGYVGIQLAPVDVFQNAYLTSRYECTLKTRASTWNPLAPLRCGF